MRLAIAATGSYAPEKRISNDELAQRLDTSDEWIFSHTGIRYRHMIADDQSNSDMAFAAAKAALDRAEVDPKDLGSIVVATCTPDFGGFPATACIVQDKLGATDVASLDVSAACSGFIYGLHVASGLAVSDPRPQLIIGSEVLTRVVNWEDRNTCVLFGDGAGAVVLKNDESGERGIIDSHLGADGTGAMYLNLEGGTRAGQPAVTGDRPYLGMDGRSVFNFAVKTIVKVIKHFLEKHNLTPDDVKYIVPHQANYRIIRAAASRQPIPEEKFYLNIEEYANTSAASIPIALDEMNRAELLNPGDLIITVGFGAGLTYGGNLIRW